MTGEAPEFWDAVGSDSRCPKRLVLAIKEADPALRYRVQTDDNEPIRAIMADHGWAPPSARKPNETPAEKAEREGLDQQNSKGAHCVDGRGGRIQNRIVGELPNEISHGQRTNILLRFAAEFEERKLPYVAVMHAPDHANNHKNWHFHLAYYAQPCNHFTGKVDDYVTGLKQFANEHEEDRHKAKAAAFKTGQFDKYVGQWDFAVPMVRVLKDRRTVVTYPFAQVKDRDCTAPGYPLELRKLLAELTNDELKIAGASRRVDPRRFSEMGIDKEAEEHLGSRSAQMESLGIVTPRGVENEHRQWHHTLHVIDDEFQNNERNTSNQERRYRQTLESRELSPADHKEVGNLITNWSQTQSEANEMKAIAIELKKHLERAQSRPLKVEETCRRHLKAIDDGKANKRQNDNEANYKARLIEATDHLLGLTVIMASEIIQEKRTREEAARLSEEAKKMRKAIDDRLRLELVALMAAATPIKGANKNAPAVAIESALAPSVANDGAKVDAEPVPDRSQSDNSLKQTTAFGAETPAKLMSRRTEVMRKIDDLAKAGEPILSAAKNGKTVYRLAEQNMQALELVEADVNSVPVQRRLHGIYKQQEADIKRLVGFIGRSPARVEISPPTIFSDNQPVIGLTRGAPADLRALSMKYAYNPIAQEQMSEALRQAKADLEMTKTTEPGAVATSTAQSPSDMQTGADEPSTDALAYSPKPPRTAPAILSDGPAPVVVSSRRPGPIEPTLAQVLAGEASHDLLRATEPVVQADQPVGVRTRRVAQELNPEKATSGVDKSVLQSEAPGSALRTDQVSIHKADQKADPLANAGKMMSIAWVARIEERQVRLIEAAGIIMAASDQPLDRGDAIFIAKAQAEFREVKARQDTLATEVANHLLMNADRFLAGTTNATDALTLELKHKWARDPAIASAVNQVWVPKPATATVNPHEAAFRTYQGGGLA